MKIKKALLGLTAVASVAAPVAATVACGTKGTDAGTAMGEKLHLSSKAGLWFVADGGKVTDKSFNESALSGVAKYGNEKNTAYNLIQPEEKGQISNAYTKAIAGGAEVIVGSGYNHGTPATSFFSAKPGVTFIGIDNDFTALKTPNLGSILFPTEQAGYLAGVFAVEYIAAHQNKFDADTAGGKKVFKAATYGGGKFVAVTSWMDGFVKGIEDGSSALYASQNMSVEMVYANGAAASDADFTKDDFNPESNQAKQLTKTYLGKGADVIFPVAGPQIKLTIDQIKLNKSKAVTIGVDGDQELALGSAYSDKIIGSALKSLKDETYKALASYYADKTAFKAEYVDRVHNGGVGYVAQGKNFAKDQYGKFFNETSIVFDVTKIKDATSVSMADTSSAFTKIK